MRRFWVLACLAALVAACTAQPPERSSLPDVGEALDPPAVCSFLVGEPLGAHVTEVLDDSGSSGVLEADDVIVAVDGEAVSGSDGLRDALAARSPGDTITVDFVRDGNDHSAEITLGENPDDPDRPFMGVMITTEYERVPATEATGEVPPTKTSRALTIAGTLYAFDPVGPAWADTGIDIDSETNWAATTESVYTLTGEGSKVLEDALTGEVVEITMPDGWSPLRLIGAIGEDLLLAVTQEVPSDPELVGVGLARVDPTTASVEWVNPTPDGFGVPVTAWGSPDSSRITVSGIELETSGLSGVELLDGEGLPAGLDEDLVPLGTPIGWQDEDRALFRTSATTLTSLDLRTGDKAEITVDPGLEGATVLAIADGHSVLGISGRMVLVDDLDSPDEVRILAEDCNVNRVGETGWGV